MYQPAEDAQRGGRGSRASGVGRWSWVPSLWPGVLVARSLVVGPAIAYYPAGFPDVRLPQRDHLELTNPRPPAGARGFPGARSGFGRQPVVAPAGLADLGRADRAGRAGRPPAPVPAWAHELLARRRLAAHLRPRLAQDRHAAPGRDWLVAGDPKRRGHRLSDGAAALAGGRRGGGPGGRWGPAHAGSGRDRVADRPVFRPAGRADRGGLVRRPSLVGPLRPEPRPGRLLSPLRAGLSHLSLPRRGRGPALGLAGGRPAGRPAAAGPPRRDLALAAPRGRRPAPARALVPAAAGCDGYLAGAALRAVDRLESPARRGRLDAPARVRGRARGISGRTPGACSGK